MVFNIVIAEFNKNNLSAIHIFFRDFGLMIQQSAWKILLPVLPQDSVLALF